MSITWENVIIAVVLTLIFIFLHQSYLIYRKFTPFRKDHLANEALFFIYMVHKDYFRDFQTFRVERGEEFAKKLNELEAVFNIDRMQDEEYRNQFRSILHKHHDNLMEAFAIFTALQHFPELKQRDVQSAIDRIHMIVNAILYDLQKVNRNQNKVA